MVTLQSPKSEWFIVCGPYIFVENLIAIHPTVDLFQFRPKWWVSQSADTAILGPKAAKMYTSCVTCTRRLLSFFSINPISMLCVFPPWPPLWKLDVTNSCIRTFLQQNQHAPHHRWVQIWSEHTQNPLAAWWWIGILGTMFMHQASTLQQITVNCLSDKSLVWDSSDWGLNWNLSKGADDDLSLIDWYLEIVHCECSSSFVKNKGLMK